jgi:hypothetical protein
VSGRARSKAGRGKHRRGRHAGVVEDPVEPLAGQVSYLGREI